MIEHLKTLNNINDNDLPVFAKETYLKTLSKDYGWFASETFIIPYVAYKKFIFKYLTFTNESIPLTDKTSSTDEKHFLNEMLAMLKKLRFDFITQPPTNVLFKVYPDKSNFCNFGTYIIDLTQNEDIIFSNIHPKHKNCIRKAIKDGVIIERGFHLNDICYQIINNTLTKQGISFIKREAFVKMINNSKDNIEFFVSKNLESYDCAAIIPWDRKTAYYLYGGSMQNHHLGSMNLLHWEVIKYFKQKGVNNYNFVGARIMPEKNSKIHGIQEFKKRFGGLLVEGYLWKYNFNPFKKVLFDQLIFLKTGKIPIDIIDYERKKSN